MADPEFARRQIAKYQAEQDQDREAIAWIDAGGRHFDQAAGATRMVDTTERCRAEKLAHIEMLAELIQLWKRDLPT